MSEAGASALSAGIGFLGNLGGSVAGGLFNANQAKINRKFQERMYNKQVEDNIKFWNMQNEYNNPSAVLERMRSAGINPLLYMSDGQMTGNIATQAPASGTAPHGAQASAYFNTAMDFANLAYLRAQTKLAESQSEKNYAEAGQAQANTENVQYDVMFKRLTQDLNIALKHGNLDQIFAATDNLREQTYATGQMTLQSTLSMMQARQYEIKRFNLDAETIGEKLKQRWYELATGRISANAQMKSAFAAVLSAQANWNLSNAQIGQIALNMSQSREMFPLLVENQRGANWNQVQDRIFKGVQISNAQKDGFTKDVHNFFLQKGVGPDTYLYKFAAPFVIPAIQVNRAIYGDETMKLPRN